MSGSRARWSLMPLLVLALSGCYSSEEVSRAALTSEEDQITEVLTRKGRRCVFRRDDEGHRGMVRDSVIVGLLMYGNQLTIPLSQVSRVSVRRFDVPATVGYSLAGAAVAGAITILILEDKGITWGR